jgi:hypothetical protein
MFMRIENKFILFLNVFHKNLSKEKINVDKYIHSTKEYISSHNTLISNVLV